ncbi:hypothetical protein TSA1_32205 [Bradyrhizobium nitroreducens]|uniref:Polysaccharide biosynthesis protein C-terminal domain-containing protein n=1 Tax=Bradyrhizobium nitroreducens TaxID=709803 RepID=A0A2M6UJW3_9BRAD|nr:hypothetical protein TSA1_32205 [Bradyrhizobium nitroreducens]
MLAIVLVQAINFIVPLVALPHIARALDVHKFGVYVVLLSYANYVLMVSDFSFNVNGPLLVAESKRDGQLRQLAIDTTALKSMLLIPALLVFAISAYLIADQNWLYVLLSGMIPITTTFTPRWIMYSVGQIYVFAGLSAVSKGLWILLVYLLVQAPDDVGILLAITALTQLLLCVLCIVLVWNESEGGSPPTLSRICAIFQNDFKQFAASIATSSLKDLGVVALSVSSSAVQVSLYALADRVRFALLGVVAPVSQSLFLVTARHKLSGGVQQRIRGLVNMAVTIGAAMCGVAVFLFSEELVALLGGGAFAHSAPLLRIVAFAPTFTALTSVLGVNTLLAEGFAAEYASAQLTCAGLAGPVLLLLVLLFGATGAALGVLLAEIIGVLVLGRACQKSGVIAKAFSLRGK